METKIEKLEDNKIKATVTVDSATVDDCIKRTYKDFALKYNFPGFRKGKAPRPVIDNAFGEETVLNTVAEDLVDDTYPCVVESEKLYPVGSPSSDDVGPVEDGKPFTFVFTVSVKPEIELTSYEPLEIELPMSEATDTEIEEQINSLREHYTTYEDAQDGDELTTDNYAELTIKATDEDGNTLDSLESESRLYERGNDLFSDAFDKEIQGIKKGQTREFSLEIPDDETSALLSTQAGKKVNFVVTCNAIKSKTVPALTDEWAKETMGVESVADLRKQVGDSITEQKAEIMPQLRENACAIELIKRFDGEVPANMAEEAETRLLQDFFTQLQRQGANFDTYLMQQNLTPDQFKEDVKLQAADEVKQQLALDAWARHKGIEATDKDVSDEFQRANVDDPVALEKKWRESGRLYLIREGIVRSKAMDDVIESAHVTEVDFAAKAQEENDEAQSADDDTEQSCEEPSDGKSTKKSKADKDSKGEDKDEDIEDAEESEEAVEK